MGCSCPVRHEAGFRKNAGCSGALIFLALLAELFMATPMILPGVRTGACQVTSSAGIVCTVLASARTISRAVSSSSSNCRPACISTIISVKRVMQNGAAFNSSNVPTPINRVSSRRTATTSSSLYLTLASLMGIPCIPGYHTFSAMHNSQ